MTTPAVTPKSWSSIVGDNYSQPIKTIDAKTSSSNTSQIKATKTEIPTSKQKQTQEVFTNKTPPKNENPFTEVHYSPTKKANLQQKYHNKTSNTQPKSSLTHQGSIARGPKEISKAAIEAIRFSQKSVNCIYTDENGRDQPLDHLKDRMSKGFNKEYALEVVKMPDGTLTSYDNRRLYLAKKILQDNADYKIWINVHPAGHNAPIGKLRSAQNTFKTNFNHPFGEGEGETKAVAEGTWGQLIALRVAGDYNSSAYKHTPFGYDKPPRVNTQ
jgi:hypothetical protein